MLEGSLDEQESDVIDILSDSVWGINRYSYAQSSYNYTVTKDF